MKLPAPRGPISAELFDALRRTPGTLPARMRDLVNNPGADDSRTSEDIQISLFACYALHCDGFEDVDPTWEWNAALLAVRAPLEARFERDLVAAVPFTGAMTAKDLPAYLLELASPVESSALGSYVHRKATMEQFRELVVHRSIDNLHEADQHTWAIPRVHGRTKSALVEIQADEYGGGKPGRMHAELYAILMTELGLDAAYGAYIEQLPAASIAILNVKSFFGLHQRWRGALLGNLAVTEIGSSIANRRFSEALTRLGSTSKARWFYDEHIEADAVHEQLAAHDMCGSFARDYPDELGRVVIGALATMDVRRIFGAGVMQAWNQDASSLRMLSLA